MTTTEEKIADCLFDLIYIFEKLAYELEMRYNIDSFELRKDFRELKKRLADLK